MEYELMHIKDLVLCNHELDALRRQLTLSNQEISRLHGQLALAHQHIKELECNDTIGFHNSSVLGGK